MLLVITILLLIFLLLGINYFPKKPTTQIDAVSYQFNFQYKLNKPSLIINMHLNGDIQNPLIINLPNNWAGIDFRDQVKLIEVKSPEKQKLDYKIEDDYRLLINLGDRTKKITVSYELTPALNDPSDVHNLIIRRDLIHSTGYGLLAVPEYNKDLDIYIDANNIPEGWNFINSFGSEQHIHDRVSIEYLQNSLYIASDNLIIKKLHGDNRDIKVIIYDKQDQKFDFLANALSNFSIEVEKFFGNKRKNNFFVSVITGEEEYYSGTALKNCFTVYLPNNFDKLKTTMLLSHEYLHHWIPDMIGIDNRDKEQLYYWWSEGFTEYYTRKLAYRAGVINLNELVSEINSFIIKYNLSEVVNIPNAKIKELFWDNYNVEKIPYYRGFIYALYLDGQITMRGNNQSLDNLMLDILNNPSKQKFSNDYFIQKCQKYLGLGGNNYFEKYIVNGELINLEEVKKILPLIKTSKGKFYLGFDENEFFSNNIIKDIDPKSNAYKSGLRNEDIILGFDFDIEKIDKKAIINTERGMFEFFPESYHKKIFYVLTKDTSETDIQLLKDFFN